MPLQFLSIELQCLDSCFHVFLFPYIMEKEKHDGGNGGREMPNIFKILHGVEGVAALRPSLR